MVLVSKQVVFNPEREDGGHPAWCKAPPQWLKMRHQRKQSHQSMKDGGPPALCNALPQVGFNPEREDGGHPALWPRHNGYK